MLSDAETFIAPKKIENIKTKSKTLSWYVNLLVQLYKIMYYSSLFA